MFTKADCDATPARLDRITANAIARARVVQAKIDHLRTMLDTSAPRPFRDASDTCEDIPNAAVLASYDAEMSRLCQIPGVMHGLYGDEVAP